MIILQKFSYQKNGKAHLFSIDFVSQMLWYVHSSKNWRNKIFTKVLLKRKLSCGHR